MGPITTDDELPMLPSLPQEVAWHQLALVTTTQGGPADEVQRVGFTAPFITGGTFTLSYNGQNTSAIAYNATAAAQVQSALEALSNIASGDVVVTKLQETSSAQEWQLAFQGALGGANLVQTTIDATNVWTMGGKTEIEATETQGSSGGDEVQTVTLSNATGGTFRLAFGRYVTAPLAYNTTAAQVDAALDALRSVDNVTVTGNAGGPWTVTFGGTQSNTNVSRLDGDASAASSGTVVRTLSYTYDAAGQLTAASDPDSSYAVSYDSLGRVLAVDNNGTSGVPRVILTSAYDAAGNRSSLSATVAGTADFLNTYTHDALDRLTRVDQTGQIGGNTVAEKRVDLAYNAISEFTSIARYKDTDGGTANEVATAAYGYDSWGRLTGLAYTKGGTNLFTPYSWTYDGLSSPGMDFGESPTVVDPRVSATGTSAVFAGMGRITQMVGQDGTSTYGYDSKSQLTSATHSYQSNETYTFDNNGNRTMTGYQTGTDNRLTNDGTYSYTYDAEGNRLTRTKTATGEVTEYTWDYHNRLTKVTEKNSQGTTTQVVEYIYDVFNRRIGRKIDTSAPFDMANAVIERYVLDDIHNGLSSFDGGNVVLDFVDADGSGAQTIALSKRYLYGEAVDQLFAQEDLSKALGDTTRNLWPLVDHLGTVRDLAKQDGTIAAHYKYDSFGNVTSGDASKTSYLFTSREFDTATRLQYNRARYFDAAVGRWISEAPLGFQAADANVARYVGNGVVAHLDPSGCEVWIACRDMDTWWGMPGGHQFLVIIPDDQKAFTSQRLSSYGLGDVGLVQMPDGRMGFTIGAHRVELHEVKQLIPIANQKADVKAALELLDPSRRGWWRPDWSTKGVKLQPIVGGAPVSDTRLILLILRRTANYIANERISIIEYDIPGEDCNSWLNTLLILIGVPIPDKDWFGFDLGHSYEIPYEFFDPPSAAQGGAKK